MRRYYNFYLSNRYEIIKRVVLLEGLKVTDVQTREVLSTGASQTLGWTSSKIVRNVWIAFKFGFESFRSDLNLSDFYEELHGYVTEDIMRDFLNSGSYRVNPPTISGTWYIPPLFNSYVDAYNCFNGILHTLNYELSVSASNRDKALCFIRFYARLCKVQLFADGNKRTAYILTVILMSFADLGLFLYLPTFCGEDTYLSHLKEYYEDESKLDSLVSYMARYYIKEV